MKKLSILLAFALVMASCKNIDFGDINKNPNGPVEPNPPAMLAGGMMNYFNNTGRDYFTNPTFYVQWQAQNIYDSEMRYADYPIDWDVWYVQVLSNFKENIDYIKENPDQVIFYGDPNNQIGVNMIMMAYVFKQVTDTYGNIPFSEALDKTITTPKYDDQISIYHGLIDMLKEARDMMDPAKPGPQGDIVYGGDVAKWQKLANSLILNAALQLSNVASEVDYAKSEFNAALNHSAGVVENVDEEMWVFYSGADRALVNPYYRLRKADYLLTKEFTDALQGEAKGMPGSCSPTYNTTFDARINIYSSSPLDDGKSYSCMEEGGGAQMSNYIWNPDDPTTPLSFFMASWTYLDRAEAAARGWTTESCGEMLTNAILASYNSLSSIYGEDITAEAAAYAAARVADGQNPNYGNSQSAEEAKLRVIAEEKWVAYFPMGFQGWTQWRRLSDYLELTPHPNPINTTGQIPRRYKYPAGEITLNPEGYKSGVQALNPPEDRNDSRIPWDQ